MPNYFIILILNLIFLLPMLNLLSSVNFISKFFFVVVNNIVSVFSISKLTVFRTFYLIIILLTFYRIFIMLFILPPMMNFRSFIKNK